MYFLSMDINANLSLVYDLSCTVVMKYFVQLQFLNTVYYNS